MGLAPTSVRHPAKVNLRNRVPFFSAMAMYPPPIPDDIRTGDTPALNKLRIYAEGLPYPIESNERLQALLDSILTRIVQCVEAKDYEPGLIQWDSMLS